MTEAHKHWECPKCGMTYDSPVPVVAVTCPKHVGPTPVVMKPRETP